MRPADVTRFESKVYPEPNSGCWLWDGGCGRGAYGVFCLNGKSHGAHRVSYEMHVGAIPDGMLVCHQCDVPSCVNPAHLWLGTVADNNADRDAKGRSARGDRNGQRTKPDRRAHGPSMHSTRDTARGVRHGWHTQPERRPLGERNARAKLSDAQVATIRAQFASGMSRKEIAEAWRTPFCTICDFISGRSRSGRRDLRS